MILLEDLVPFKLVQYTANGTYAFIRNVDRSKNQITIQVVKPRGVLASAHTGETSSGKIEADYVDPMSKVLFTAGTNYPNITCATLQLAFECMVKQERNTTTAFPEFLMSKTSGFHWNSSTVGILWADRDDWERKNDYSPIHARCDLSYYHRWKEKTNAEKYYKKGDQELENGHYYYNNPRVKFMLDLGFGIRIDGIQFKVICPRGNKRSITVDLPYTEQNLHRDAVQILKDWLRTELQIRYKVGDTIVCVSDSNDRCILDVPLNLDDLELDFAPGWIIKINRSKKGTTFISNTDSVHLLAWDPEEGKVEWAQVLAKSEPPTESEHPVDPLEAIKEEAKRRYKPGDIIVCIEDNRDKCVLPERFWEHLSESSNGCFFMRRGLVPGTHSVMIYRKDSNKWAEVEKTKPPDYTSMTFEQLKEEAKRRYKPGDTIACVFMSRDKCVLPENFTEHFDPDSDRLELWIQKGSVSGVAVKMYGQGKWAPVVSGSVTSEPKTPEPVSHRDFKPMVLQKYRPGDLIVCAQDSRIRIYLPNNLSDLLQEGLGGIYFRYEGNIIYLKLGPTWAQIIAKVTETLRVSTPDPRMYYPLTEEDAIPRFTLDDEEPVINTRVETIPQLVPIKPVDDN